MCARLWVFVIPVIVSFSLGCPSDTGPDPDPDEDAGPTTEPPTYGEPFTLEGYVISFVNVGRVAGAEVCLAAIGQAAQEGRCATTAADDDRLFSLPEVPDEAPVRLEIDHPDYVPGTVNYQTFRLRSGEEVGSLISYVAIEVLLGALGENFDVGRGHLGLGLYYLTLDGEEAGRVAGVSVTPADGDPSGTYYLSESFFPEDGATETSASGVAAVLNLEPGRRTVALSGLPSGCVIRGDADDEEDGVQVDIVEGRMAIVRANCPAP